MDDRNIARRRHLATGYQRLAAKAYRDRWSVETFTPAPIDAIVEQAKAAAYARAARAHLFDLLGAGPG